MGTGKAYRGMAMEGPIATWYTKNTGRGARMRWFVDVGCAIAQRVTPGGRVLEVAPGPGFLAIEIARSGRCSVAGLDISESFVRIARENAERAGVAVEFHRGNASEMPFADASFDFVVCSAAFKNFSDPVGALNEMHRVLAPGGRASIYDLLKDVSRDDIEREVRSMQLSGMNSLITRFIFRFSLLKRAYTRDALQTVVSRSRFGGGHIETAGIGFELQLTKANSAWRP